MAKICAYIRVSTQRQGASGLGLDAQTAAIEAFARQNGHTIVATFREIESGKRCDRPQLTRALAKCRLLGATLCVAKLDRLARDLAFVANLMRDNVDFVACDAQYANRLTIGILAAVGEDEARRVSERTRAALAQAKLRGVVLGGSRNHTFSADERRKGSALGCATRSEASRERASQLMPIIGELRAEGRTSLQQLAEGLNARGLPTARGKAWQPMQVRRVINAASWLNSGQTKKVAGPYAAC